MLPTVLLKNRLSTLYFVQWVSPVLNKHETQRSVSIMLVMARIPCCSCPPWDSAPEWRGAGCTRYSGSGRPVATLAQCGTLLLGFATAAATGSVQTADPWRTTLATIRHCCLLFRFQVNINIQYMKTKFDQIKKVVNTVWTESIINV